MKRLLALVAILMLGSIPPAGADRVLLKNGSSFEGTIVRQDEASVTLRTDLGEMTLPRNQIARLDGGQRASGATPLGTEPAGGRPEPARPQPALSTLSREPATPGSGIQATRERESMPPAEVDSSPISDSHGSGTQVVPDPSESSSTRGWGPLESRFGIGVLLGLVVVYLGVSFASSTGIAWALSHAMSVRDSSPGNALKLTVLQWGISMLLMVLLGGFVAVLGGVGDAGRSEGAGAMVLCALPVFGLVIIGVNIGTVARVLDLGIGRSILFVVGQGVAGCAVDVVLRLGLAAAVGGP